MRPLVTSPLCKGSVRVAEKVLGPRRGLSRSLQASGGCNSLIYLNATHITNDL